MDDPLMKDDEELEGDDDMMSEDYDPLMPLAKGKKSKDLPLDDGLLGEDEESLDDLADKEDDLLPEDGFDDVDSW